MYLIVRIKDGFLPYDKIWTVCLLLWRVHLRGTSTTIVRSTDPKVEFVDGDPAPTLTRTYDRTHKRGSKDPTAKWYQLYKMYKLFSCTRVICLSVDLPFLVSATNTKIYTVNHCTTVPFLFSLQPSALYE